MDKIKMEEEEMKKKEQDYRNRVCRVAEKLNKISELNQEDKDDICEYFYDIGIEDLADTAFRTGRITEYEYYRLMIEDEKKDWIRCIAQKKFEIQD